MVSILFFFLKTAHAVLDSDKNIEILFLYRNIVIIIRNSLKLSSTYLVVLSFDLLVMTLIGRSNLLSFPSRTVLVARLPLSVYYRLSIIFLTSEFQFWHVIGDLLKRYSNLHKWSSFFYFFFFNFFNFIRYAIKRSVIILSHYVN